MIAWKRQGEAVIGRLGLRDGRAGNVALVGAQSNPKGAALIVPAGNGGDVERLTLAEALDLLSPRQVVDILAVQERCFGMRGLPPLLSFSP